jgi:hypothetical protein
MVIPNFNTVTLFSVLLLKLLFKIENIEGVVNNLVSKGIAYTVTLYPFFTSSYDH